MAQIVEINRIEDLSDFGQAWDSLLEQTRNASFFQSRQWLESYWRHFGAATGQRLRVLVRFDSDRPTGILPLAVVGESTWVGRMRTLTYPLHNWASFYGPIGPDPAGMIRKGLTHIRNSRRDWDILELRWHGAVRGELPDVRGAMTAAGFQSYRTIWNHTSIVDLDGTWNEYWSARKGAWLRRFRNAERKLQSLGELTYMRYRPAGLEFNDGDPRWDLYDACERLAAQSWQARATDGTTLSDESVREFLREVHQAAAAAGAVDLNLLMLDQRPIAFIYGYHRDGYVYGLRRGYDSQLPRSGAGNVLLARAIRDCFARGDRAYDMGIGSLESKRHFQTRLVPILRYSHYPPAVPRSQILRLRRWRQARRLSASIAAGGDPHLATDRR